MNKLILTIGVVFAAACGGKSGGETMDPCKDPCKDKPQAAMTCEDVGANLAADMRAEGESPSAADERLPEAIVSECTSAGWSQETIDCMGAATTPEDGERCEGTMTEDQKSSMRTAVEAALEAAYEEDGGGEEMD